MWEVTEKYYMCLLLFAFWTERIFRKISALSLKFNFVLPLLEVNIGKIKTQFFVRKFTPLAHLLVFSRFTASKSSTKLKWSIKVMDHSFSTFAIFSAFLIPCTRACAYQGVWNVSFLQIFANVLNERSVIFSVNGSTI